MLGRSVGNLDMTRWNNAAQIVRASDSPPLAVWKCSLASPRYRRDGQKIEKAQRRVTN